MKKIALFMIWSVVFCIALEAQPRAQSPFDTDSLTTWRASGPPGGYVRAMIVNPANSTEILAATSGNIAGYGYGQLFRSIDGGTSWTAHSVLGEIYDLAFDPGNRDIIFALSYSGIYKSFDKGASWFLVPFKDAGFAGGRIYICPTNTNIIVVTGWRWYKYYPEGKTCMSILRSIDAGLTWTSIQIQPDSLRGGMGPLAAAPSNPLILFAGGGNQNECGDNYSYVFKSQDAGATWVKVSELIAGISGFIIHPTNPKRIIMATADGVYLSTSSGANWEMTSTFNSTTLAQDRNNPDILYAGSDTACYKSIDGGRIWAASATNLPGNGQSILSAGRSVLYGSTAGIFKSTDGGRVFKASQRGLNASNITALAISPSSPSTIYAESAGAGIFWSTDSGKTWKKQAGFSGFFGLNRSKSLKIIVESSSSKKIVVLADNPESDDVYKSADGGLTWKHLLKSEVLFDVAVAPTNSQFMAAVGSVKILNTSCMGVFLSKDGGNSWTTKFPCTAPGSIPSSIAIDPRNSRIVYVGGSRNRGTALYKSVNGGQIWKDISGSIQGKIIDIVIDKKSEGKVYVVSEYGIYRTENGGASWTHILLDYSLQTVALHPTELNTLYAAGIRGISKSSDGGTLWTEFNNGLAVPYIQSLGFNYYTKVLYAATGGGGVYRIQQ
jgi:photosystem II stability/assembly factor-like uncharacterized protein